jgi:hypothetical protein
VQSASLSIGRLQGVNPSDTDLAEREDGLARDESDIGSPPARRSRLTLERSSHVLVALIACLGEGDDSEVRAQLRVDSLTTDQAKLTTGPGWLRSRRDIA